MLGTGCRVQDAGYRVLGTGFWVQRCRVHVSIDVFMALYKGVVPRRIYLFLHLYSALR